MNSPIHLFCYFEFETLKILFMLLPLPNNYSYIYDVISCIIRHNYQAENFS